MVIGISYFVKVFTHRLSRQDTLVEARWTSTKWTSLSAQFAYLSDTWTLSRTSRLVKCLLNVANLIDLIFQALVCEYLNVLFPILHPVCVLKIQHSLCSVFYPPPPTLSNWCAWLRTMSLTKPSNLFLSGLSLLSQCIKHIIILNSGIWCTNLLPGSY